MEDEDESLFFLLMDKRDLQFVEVCWLMDNVVVIVVSSNIFDMVNNFILDVSAQHSRSLFLIESSDDDSLKCCNGSPEFVFVRIDLSNNMVYTDSELLLDLNYF